MGRSLFAQPRLPGETHSAEVLWEPSGVGPDMFFPHYFTCRCPGASGASGQAKQVVSAVRSRDAAGRPFRSCRGERSALAESRSPSQLTFLPNSSQPAPSPPERARVSPYAEALEELQPALRREQRDSERLRKRAMLLQRQRVMRAYSVPRQSKVPSMSTQSVKEKRTLSAVEGAVKQTWSSPATTRASRTRIGVCLDRRDEPWRSASPRLDEPRVPTGPPQRVDRGSSPIPPSSLPTSRTSSPMPHPHAQRPSGKREVARPFTPDRYSTALSYWRQRAAAVRSRQPSLGSCLPLLDQLDGRYSAYCRAEAKHNEAPTTVISTLTTVELIEKSLARIRTAQKHRARPLTDTARYWPLPAFTYNGYPRSPSHVGVQLKISPSSLSRDSRSWSAGGAGGLSESPSLSPPIDYPL